MKTRWNLDDYQEAEDFVSFPKAHFPQLTTKWWEALHQYARLKLDAHAARIAGHIARAFAIEQKMDDLYQRLPPKLRW